MSQRRAKGRPSMARVELDTPAGVRVERVRQIASALIGQLEREPSSNEESLVALMMVADLFGRNAGFSDTKIDVLALFAEDCAAQAFDQHAEKIN
jgi:hypothetical protein